MKLPQVVLNEIAAELHMRSVIMGKPAEIVDFELETDGLDLLITFVTRCDHRFTVRLQEVRSYLTPPENLGRC